MKFRDRLSLAWRVLRQPETNSTRYAADELALALPTGGEDRMNDAMRRDVQEILLVFASQGHSGFSASYATGLAERLMRFEPLVPLTGEDDEWMQVSNEGVYQNRRCSHIFKEDGEAYDINGYVFEEASGARYTGSMSRRRVTFPHTPEKPIIVKVNDDGMPILKKYAFLRSGAINA